MNFINENEKSSVPLPVNVMEAVMKGLVRCDEPTTPLKYLFSPKILGSNLAKIAVYAGVSWYNVDGDNWWWSWDVDGDDLMNNDGDVDFDSEI